MFQSLPLALPLLLVLFACSSPSDPADGGVDVAVDSGTGAAVDAGADAGIADAGPTLPALGSLCAYGTDACGEARLCSSLFSDGQGGIDEAGATCFARCSAQGQSCVAAFDASGSCQGVSQPGGGQLACVVTSGNFGPCANSHNAVCTQGMGCVRIQNAAVGTCVVVCDPNDDLCPGTLRCSTSPLQVTLPGGGTGGVCGEPSTVGDPCNPDPDQGPVQVCTDGQLCGRQTRLGPYSCSNP